MRRVEAIKDLEGAGEANLAERLKEMDGWVGPATWSETGKPGKDRPFTWLIYLIDWFTWLIFWETKFFVDFWWPQKPFDSFDVRMCVMSLIWRVQNWDGVPPKAGRSWNNAWTLRGKWGGIRWIRSHGSWEYPNSWVFLMENPSHR
jgi:hypothetical protein